MKDNAIACQLADLNDNELAEVIAKAQAIRTARQNARKEEDWRKVANTIREYQEKYGDICVEDVETCMWIDSTSDFSTAGEICLAWRD